MFNQKNAPNVKTNYRDDLFSNFDDNLDIDPIVKEDRIKMTSHEFLENHGLPQISKAFSQIIMMFDTSTHFFSKLDDDEQFGVLNRVVEAFRDSYVKTVNDMSQSKSMPSGSFSINVMKDFFSRQEANFNTLLQQHQNILDSEWAKLLGHTHYVFDALKDLYALALANSVPGFPVNSFIMELSVTFIRGIPDDLLDRTNFSEVLQMPGMLQDFVHDYLETALTSSFGPMIKMFVQVLANYASQRHTEL